MFLIAPPLLLPLGAVVLGSRLLPRAFGHAAVAFGVASIILGLAALFSATAFSLAIILIIAESAWVLAAAGTLVISPKPASGPPAPAQPLPQGTGSRTSASPPQYPALAKPPRVRSDGRDAPPRDDKEDMP